MFSDVELSYVKSLVSSMRSKGYSNYVAYTDSYSTNYQNWQSDLHIVFSKEKITSTSFYSFSIPASSVMYSVDSSTSSSINNKIQISNFSGNLNIDTSEFVYTNAEYGESVAQIHPDINTLGGRQNENIQGIGFLIALFILICIAFRIFC